jgi:polyisoprenoid-binding protein YceI
VFSVPIKSFEFENGMMQEHFNQEGVMNSNKYPISKFKGVIEDFKAINFNKNGVYPVTIKGDLTIKGVVLQTTQNGRLIMDNQVVKLELTFDLDRFLWGMKAKEGNVSQILKIELESIFN